MKLKPKSISHAFKITNHHNLLLAFIIFSILKFSQQIQISNIEMQNQTISTTTSYKFLFERNDTAPNIPTGSYLQINFPSEFINRISYINGQNVNCSSVELTSPNIYCNYVSNVLKVYQAFQGVTSIKRFYLTVNGILNPFPAKTYGQFKVSIHESNDNLFEEGNLGAQITTTPGRSECSITNYENNFVYSRGSILISYKSQFVSSFNSSYKISLSMNNTYGHDPSMTLISPQISGYSSIGVSGSFKFTLNYSTGINVSLIFPPSTMRVGNLIYMEASVQNEGGIDWCYLSLDNILPSPMQLNISAEPAIVQQLSTYTFSLNPGSGIFPSDSLIVEFPSSYNLSSILSTNAIFFNGIFTTKSFQVTGQLLNISSLVTTSLTPRNIKFNLTKITNPFRSNLQTITLKIVTSDGYERTKGSYSLQIDPGTMKINSFTCVTYQIGQKSSCKLNFTLSNAINLNSEIRLTFPREKWMTSYSGSNTVCKVSTSSPQIKSSFQCRYLDNIKSLVLTQFTEWTNVTTISPFTAMVNIEQNTIDVDHRIQLPWDVGSYALSLASYTADSFVIDHGQFTLTTSKREIFKNQNNTISFYALKTMTISDISVTYTLPHINGGSYKMMLYLPLQLTGTFSDIRSTYGTIQSFDSINSLLTIRMNDITLITNTFNISGFKTYISTKPITYTIEILYNEKTYYYFSTVVSIPDPKSFTTLNIQQQSQIVYQSNNVSLLVSQLHAGDILLYSTSDYTGYQVVNSSSNWCSPLEIINCNPDGSIKILSVNNADSSSKLTKFYIIIKNSPFVGKSTFTLTVYDSSRLYFKQNGTFTINVLKMNSIPSNSLTYSSTNPYFNESSTLTISLTLSTPGANSLTVTFPANYVLLNSKCFKNCELPVIDSQNIFIAQINGLQISVEFQIINPMNFTEPIVLISKDLIDRNVDYGEIQLKQKCASPCRSCSSNDPASCTSCYNFSINKTLSATKCVTSCLDGEYQVSQSSMFYCLTCPSSCTKCTSSSTCQQCKNTFIYFNGSCISNCPSGFYLSVDSITSLQQCLTCTSPCKQCSIKPTNCSLCSQGTYLFENNCLSNCPAQYYKSANGKCNPCPKNCSQCQDTTGYCILCVSNFYLFQQNCYSQCPIAGYAKNQSSGKCQPCTASCATCGQFIDQCLNCKQKYFLMNGVCLTSCPSGYYNNVGTRKCQLCLSPCKQCLGSQSYCQSCIAGKFLYNHQCYDQCPDGSYISVNSTVPSCSVCPWPCSLCSDAFTCSKCSSPYALNVSQCVLNCGDGNFINSNNQCQECNSKCKTCNRTGCIDCSSQQDFLFDQSCVKQCSPLLKNQLTMKCQQCQSPCASCSKNSSTCTQCISTYLFLPSESKCLLTCPPSYFSENSYCKLCQQRNPNCKQCSIDNVTKVFSCSECQAGAYFYGSICVDKCPKDTYISNGICVSSNCTQIQNCQLCSDLKCIACKSLYTLQSNQCQIRVVSAISNLKAPFPFLILVLCTILSSIAVKVYFQKMYIPLYLYAFCGIFEIGCMALWTGLGIMTSRFNLQQEPVNFYFAALLILVIYVVMNLGCFLVKFLILQNDKNFKYWERQDNKSVSILVSLVSVAISFRFQLIIFSKLGNRESFSAVVQKKQKFLYLLSLSIMSIFSISIPTICLCCYLIYLQQQMNYLFFTCIQMAIISLIMIILSILAYLTPKDYVTEKKQEYKKGYVEENFVDGKSLTGLLCVEEEYYEEASVITAQKNDGQKYASQQQISSLNNDQNDTRVFINTKLSVQAIQVNQIDSQINLAQNIIINSKTNLINYESTIKSQQVLLEQESREQITILLEKTLIRKQNILKQLIQEQNNQIMNEINQNFGIIYEEPEQNQNVNIFFQHDNKKVGKIKRQLYNKYQTYGNENQSDFGENLDQEDLQQQEQTFQDFEDFQQEDEKAECEDEDFQEQNQSQENQDQEAEENQQQVNSSKLLNGIQQVNNPNQRNKFIVSKDKNKQTILTNHQTLSLTEEDNFMQQTLRKQTIQKNLKNIQKIKSLLQELAKQQREEQNLKMKLHKLNNDLQSEDYLKLRQKIQHNNMTLQDKLSRLNQIYYKEKNLRDNKKTNHKIYKNNTFSLNRNQIKRNLRYEGQQNNLQQILPRKIKIQSGKNRLLKNSKNIELKTKNSNKQNPISKRQQNKQKSQIIKNIEKRKLYSAQLSNRVKKSLPLQPINEQERKSENSLLYVPMLSQRTNNVSNTKDPELIKIYPILPQKALIQQNFLSNQAFLRRENQQYIIEQEHKSNTSRVEEQDFISKKSQLKFTQPLKEDQPSQAFQKQSFAYQNNKINKKNQQSEKQSSVNQTKRNHLKIQYHDGPTQAMNKDFNHWPIDPQVKQRIIEAEKLARQYLKPDKNKKSKISKYASATLNPYHLPAQKSYLVSGSQSKFTQANFEKIERMSKDNSIFNAARQSQIQFNYPQGEMLVFEDDEDIIDEIFQTQEKSFQRNSKNKQNRVLELNIESKRKVPKKRANKSVINLSPGKY